MVKYFSRGLVFPISVDFEINNQVGFIPETLILCAAKIENQRSSSGIFQYDPGKNSHLEKSPLLDYVNL